jgi:hypothetical protein
MMLLVDSESKVCRCSHHIPLMYKRFYVSCERNDVKCSVVSSQSVVALASVIQKEGSDVESRRVWM